MKDKHILSVVGHNECSKHPSVRLMLAGKYLNDYGFNLHDQVVVQYIAPGKLTLTNINNVSI